MSTVTRSSLFAGVACVLAAVFPASRAHADTFSWSTSNYTYNTTQTGTSAVPGPAGMSTGGTAVSVEYGNSTYFSNSTLNPNSPASPAVGTYGTGANAYYTNGGTTGASALQIIADFDNGGAYIAGSSIPVTVLFSKPVSGLIFSFYDVDGGVFPATNGSPYDDTVTNIFGLGTGSAMVAPISITNGATNTHTIGATSATITSNPTTSTTYNSAQNAADGNSTVTFGSTPITQFTFTYTDTGATGTNPHSTIQLIGLSDLQLNVPEPSTWACFAAAAGLGCWTLRRRARRQV